jgi:hypothetical protein
MLSYLPPVLNQSNWGVHINSEKYFAPPPDCPDWLTPLQKQDWQNRGVTVWDANLRIVTHLYARYALNLLKDTQDTNTWQASGLVIGSLTHQIILYTNTKKQSDETDSETLKENWILRNKIEFTPGQAADLCAFLTAQEEALKQIATDDDREARDVLGKVYRLIAEYGRKIREGRKEVGAVLESHKKKIIPTTLQKGEYFTIPQAAEACNMTSRQIRAWIRKGVLEAVELPGLGLIIEAETLAKLIYKREFTI